jgi:hypothetical protein
MIPAALGEHSRLWPCGHEKKLQRRHRMDAVEPVLLISGRFCRRPASDA